ncbi:hypothetical protein ABZ297_45195 [Nonomuraea sp. NPDC005983]|uniref:hypothetical protein n=1 Tax=Nonomuraea sp. NPDC005983 TaxID=3155595 RepID=UPI0033BBCC6B
MLNPLSGYPHPVGRAPAPHEGFAKLLRLIEDAKTAGIDRVTHATYQTPERR